MNKKVIENRKKGTFLWEVAAIVLFFSVSMYIFYRHNEAMLERRANLSDCKINKISGDIEEQINSLKNDISRLDKQVTSVPGSKNIEISPDNNRDILRKKWKTWVALRRKMESNESFEEELKTFHELFACDDELLNLVDDLARGTEVITNGDGNKILGTCKNILRKIIKLKKINQRKLVEISGYVLSSIDNCVKEK